MRLVIQRVATATVSCAQGSRSIKKGLVVLFGAGANDDERHVGRLAQKTANLRIFEDENGKMNLSALSCGHELLVVPNFTLHADASHGLRPSFTDAARPETALSLYEAYLAGLRGILPEGRVQSGFFGEVMTIDMQCHGPVTILLDTDEWEKGSG